MPFVTKYCFSDLFTAEEGAGIAAGDVTHTLRHTTQTGTGYILIDFLSISCHALINSLESFILPFRK
jgi:hypothetical protein